MEDLMSGTTFSKAITILSLLALVSCGPPNASAPGLSAVKLLGDHRLEIEYFRGFDPVNQRWVLNHRIMQTDNKILSEWDVVNAYLNGEYSILVEPDADSLKRIEYDSFTFEFDTSRCDESSSAYIIHLWEYEGNVFASDEVYQLDLETGDYELMKE